MTAMNVSVFHAEHLLVSVNNQTNIVPLNASIRVSLGLVGPLIVSNASA